MQILQKMQVLMLLMRMTIAVQSNSGSRYVNDDWEDEDITEMDHHMFLKIKLLVILRYVHDAAFCEFVQFSAVFCVINTFDLRTHNHHDHHH